MLESARLAQFVGAVILFGSPLFLLYTPRLPAPAALRPKLAAACALLLAGALAYVSGQTALMMDGPNAAFDPASLWTVMTGTQFGLAAGSRIAAALAALAVCLSGPLERGRTGALAILGGLSLASFAWSGHGAADDGLSGAIHLTADVIHLLAAGVWLGALTVLVLHVFAKATSPEALHAGLKGFSGVGTAGVAAIVATGLVNSWFLIGPAHISALLNSTYGGLLLAKLVVFAAMLGLAALNRYVLTPRLAASADLALPALKRSLLVESVAGFLVLALVSALGAVPPPGS